MALENTQVDVSLIPDVKARKINEPMGAAMKTPITNLLVPLIHQHHHLLRTEGAPVISIQSVLQDHQLRTLASILVVDRAKDENAKHSAQAATDNVEAVEEVTSFIESEEDRGESGCREDVGDQVDLQDAGLLDCYDDDRDGDECYEDTDINEGQPAAENIVRDCGDHGGLEGVEDYGSQQNSGERGAGAVPAQLRATTMTTTKPTTHADCPWSSRKKASPPYSSGVQTPAQAAMNPVELMRSRMIKTANEARPHPIHKSLSVLEAKARIQKLERNMSLNTIPIRRMEISW